MKKTTYRFKHKDKFTQEPLPAALPVTAAVKQSYEEGKVLLIDKDLHWTSFDIIRKMRPILQLKKIGHAGTLDPLATGLLIICTGKFTKKINEYMAQTKEYTGSFTLGAVTASYDLETEPEQQKDFSGITAEQLQRTTGLFTGAIEQLPPIHSAIKMEGTPLYEMARRGEEIERKPRQVHIHAFEITSVDLPTVTFRVSCSTGTYIRSLAHDFGQALGCGAYLSSLRRTKIGDFSVENAVRMVDFIEGLNGEIVASSQ